MISKRILFIVREMKMEHLGIMYLMSALKVRGHTVKLIRIDRSDGNHFSEISEFCPDFICYSVCSGSEKYYFNLDFEIRCKTTWQGYQAVYGGPAVTFDPVQFENRIYIRGEGEQELVNLVEDIPYSDLKLVDLDTIPFPDRETVYSYPDMRNNPIKNMMTRRGCRFSCAYCFNSTWNIMHKGQCKDTVRLRKVTDVIKEAVELKEKWQPLRMIHIMDDGFARPVRWLREFVEPYRRHVGIPFICNVHPRDITDETAGLLSEAGCAIISLAIESANDDNRKNILNRVGSREDVREAIRICDRYGIRTRLQNIIGLPVDNPLKDAFETLDFNISCSPTSSWCAILQCYRGTSIYEIAEKKGYIPEDGSVDDGFFGVSTLKIRDRILIEKLHKLWPLITSYPKIFRPLAGMLIRIPLPFAFYRYVFKITKKYLSERDLWKVFK